MSQCKSLWWYWNFVLRWILLLCEIEPRSWHLCSWTRHWSIIASFLRQVISPVCCLKWRYTFGNCQRPVSSLGVSHHKHKITSLWTFELNWSSEFRGNDERKNTLSDRNKRLLARSLLLFYWEITSFPKTMLLQRESFPTMYYTTNSSPMLVTTSVFKLIFVLYFPFSANKIT